MRPEGPLYQGLPNKGKNGQGSVNTERQHKVRKRGTLKEDSSLRLKGINMSYINLGRLINRKSCTIPYTLFRNRYQVLTSALANSRANTFALIDI